MQAGCFVGGQSLLIFACLFWKMPPELKGNAGGLIFWIINIILVAASILQVAYLASFKPSTKGSMKRN
ncbi:unnamed protein product [Allacma fusca]|uniref:Uncharacterized protein n=1 Tax=Allacma fusca TaxID=39272 RepID=A0A8J2PGR2_9HEXA|nr:unnamed protein product [Allacma fusca]